MNWINCKDRLPEIRDASVLVYFFDTESIETVHIEDYFKDISCGRDSDGSKLCTKWYLYKNVTHWMELPEPPLVDKSDSVI